jgi:hypothetical protein
LKRTPPIRGEQVDFTGVTYVGEGGLGVPQRTPLGDRWYLQAPGMAASAHHVQLLSFEAETLRYQAILEDGTIADEVTIQPHDDRLEHRITATMASAPAADRVQITLSRPFDEATALDPAAYSIEPEVAIEEVVIGAEVDDVLRLVNSAGLEELDDDVSLDARAAANIVSFRAGEDAALGTEDDRRIESWADLDAIAWVGPRALGKLFDYARDLYGNPRNVVTLRTGELESEQNYRVTLGGIADLEGSRIAAGTTVSFLLTDETARADSITNDGGDATETAGCATSPSRGAAPVGSILLVIGLIGVRRWRSKNYDERSAKRNRTGGSRSRR